MSVQQSHGSQHHMNDRAYIPDINHPGMQESMLLP